jgi:hypothetical protein
MNKLTSALAGIGRRFINPYGSRLDRRVAAAKWGDGKPLPHQNEREISRRLRQECMKLMKAQIIHDSVSGRASFSYSKWDELVSDPETFAKFRTSSSAKLLELRDYLKTEAA